MDTLGPMAIGDLAGRTGFSPDTLRYYERLGILPAPARTASGRRAYDRRALDRLVFVARAKELGCSLDEIASLVTAFDDDCAVVADQLRILLDDKIVDAQRRVAELVALTAQLQEARHRLAGAAPDGACGPECACSGHGAVAPVTGAGVQLVMAPEIACTLGHGQVADRVADWQAALGTVTHREGIDGGVRLLLPAGTDVGEVLRLAQAEWACCSFFSFALTVDQAGTALEVRAPGDAADVVAAMFGVAA